MYVSNKSNIIDYDHPFNVTIINDNSAMPRPQTAAASRVNFLNVFAGGKGRDNKLIRITSKAEFIKEFGVPNAEKYGQAILNAYASVIDQYSHAYCMRVMPEDACYSNLVILAKYKVNDEGNLEIKLHNESFGSVKDPSGFEILFENGLKNEEDEAGYKVVPLFAVRCLGRGIYGNAYRIRLTNVFSRRRNLDYRAYRLEILNANEGNIVEETFDGCLYDHSVNSRSLSFYDVLDGDTLYSNAVVMNIFEDGFKILYDVYKDLFKDADLPVENYKMFDPIFGTLKDQSMAPKMVIDNSQIAMDRLDGVPLRNGSDGALADPGDKTVDQVIEELYIKAFNGDLDKAILSSRRSPVKFMLDAGYPINVKRAMVQLALKRYDAMVYLDAGYITTHEEALIFGEETYDLNYRIVSKSYQHYQIRDPFTGKRIPVTMTYDLACNLARHIDANGLNIPYTGELYATLKGAIKNTMVPVLDECDEDLKEKLYDLRLNYYEAIADNVFARGTQQTSQDHETDLSEENNMLVVLEIKDIAERETISRRYNFAEPNDRRIFTEMLNEKIRHVKDMVREVQVFYDMSPEEEARSVIHCYIEVIFKTMAKSSIVEININRRV